MKIQAKTRNILIGVLLLVMAAGLGLLLTAGSDASGQAGISSGGAVTVATPAMAAKTATSAAGAIAGNGITGGADAAAGPVGDGSGAGSGESGPADQSTSGGSGGGSGQPVPQSPQPQTIGLKPGNVFLYTHQDNEFHNLVAGLPVDFTVNVQLWIPGNNNQILTIDQPASVWVEYWKSPGGAKQTVNLSHWKNDQGNAWWVMSIPPLAPGSYEARAYAATGNNTVSITGVFTINNN
ncbi:MAG: hypothetical protein ACYC6Z_10095 [Thermoleophilia bacterium]